MSISAGYTERELQKIWTLPETQQNRLLRPALAKLYEDPNVSEKYLTEWTSVLQESVQLALGNNVFSKPRTAPRGGHERFVRSCMDAGLATAMLRVSELTTPHSKRARVHALSIWCGVATIASKTPEQARPMNNNLVGIKSSLLKSLTSETFMQRAKAVLCLRQFAWGPWTKYLSLEDVAEIMVECLFYASLDDVSVMNDLMTRDGSWQRELMLEMENTSDVFTMEKAQDFAPRFYSQSRDDALHSVAGLLYCRETHTIRRDCRDLVNKEPLILDYLLTIIGFDRSSWHPEAVADATAAQILAYLLQTPYCTVPELWDEMVSPRTMGFSPGARGESDVSYVTHEWIAHVESCENFVELSRYWRQRLLVKWKKIQNETYEDILRKFQQASKYMTVEAAALDEAKLDNAISERGVCRSCILRIFVNLTHGGFKHEPAKSALVPTPELLSLLPVAYEASQRVPSESRAVRSKRHASGAQRRDAWLRLERTKDLFVVPSGASSGRKCLASAIVFPEYILGPVLLFRILRRINERASGEFGTHVGSWASLPPNTPQDTHLEQIQQIASADVLDILMRNVVLKRIPSQKDEGTQRLRQKYADEDKRVEADYARSAYLAAAELAIAVDQFYGSAGIYRNEWEDMMRMVKKERIACLGNVSEMSSRLGEWSHQYWYARHAIGAIDDSELDVVAAKRDGWDPAEMRAKNERRLTKAQSNILARFSR